MSLKRLPEFLCISMLFIVKIDSQICGNSVTSTILDAGNATENAWPWMVAIRKRERSGIYTPWCSGFLIDRRHVLSAAHCYQNQNNDQYRARIGSINQDEAEEYRITRIAAHPGHTFTVGMFNDDIAVLTLDREADFQNFNPICLPDQEIKEMDLKGRNTTIAGWGSGEPGGRKIKYLQQLNGLPVIPNKDCERAFRERLRNSFERQFPLGIDSRFICAAYPNGEKCSGEDSGGPLMMQNKNRWYVVGIISFGLPCGTGMPGGYTNVSNYLDWIKENVKDHLVCGTSHSVLPRLVEGNATEGAWPWMVAIRMRNSSGIYTPHWCSGFLIDRRHVLSAAHCYNAENNDQYRVRIGSINQDEAEEYRISRIAVPEGYTKGTFYDDLAVLTLNREVTVQNYNSVCLPDEQVSLMDLIGRSSTVAGWKSNRTSGKVNIYLQHLGRLPIIYDKECQRIYGQALGPIFQRQFPIGINSGFICAGYIDGGKDACEFNSGGPLMIQNKNQWYAVGVLSFGACKRFEIPDGYVKISNYLDWIKENIQD